MDEVTRITSPILITGKNRGKQIDYRYGPYISLDHANSVLGPNGLDCIYEGLTIGIGSEDENLKEFWYKNGSFVPKESENTLYWIE